MKLSTKIVSLVLMLCTVCCICFSSAPAPKIYASQKMSIGDVDKDGQITAKDVLAIRKYLAKWDVVIDTKEADMNYDKKVDVKDALVIRKVLAKITDIDFITYYDLGKNDYANNRDYELFWSDEFNGNKLNTAFWDYEYGYVRNNEPQFYTRRRTQNVAVENGYLRITALREDYNGAKYTSGSINTKNRVTFQYGAVEMRAKLPSSKNNPKATWPAFWMMGNKSSWPNCGETDILEMYGQNFQKYEANVHWGNSNGKHVHLWDTMGGVPTYYTDDGSDLGDGWHVYGVEWTDKYMRFYCDDVTLKSIDITGEDMSELHYENYILINLALQNSQISSAKDEQFPIDYLVDYVRVYQKKA